MEAQLNDPKFRHDSGTGISHRRPDRLNHRLMCYLRAAGAAEETQARRIVDAILDELPSPGMETASWTAIIAAVDTRLAAELPRAAPLPSLRPMPLQDLRRPGLREAALLLRVQVPRSARAMAACLTWLIVLIIP